MKKILLTLGLLAAMVPTINAETYDWPTMEMPSGVMWTPTTAAPGVYESLVGRYECNLGSVYTYMYSTQLFSKPKAYIVNADNEIVLTPQVAGVGTGMRNGNQMYFTISDSEAITTPGTYYIIFPASTDPSKPGQVMDYVTGNIEEIYNLKAGPYIVGELGEPVDAEITVSPTGTLEQPQGVFAFTVTVNNADILNAANLANDQDGYAATITVTGPNGAITMEPGVREGNTITWEFPYDGAIEATGVLPGGEYSVTINYANFAAFTSGLNPITFPADKVTYNFTLEAPIPRVIPTYTKSPNFDTFETWPLTDKGTQTSIGFNLSGYWLNYQNATELKENVPELLLVDPEGVTYSLPVAARFALNSIGYTTTEVDFTKYGDYTCYWKIGGYEGRTAAAYGSGDIVIFEDIVITYTHPEPREVVTPEIDQVTPKAEIAEWTSSIIGFKVSNGYYISTRNGEALAAANYPALSVTSPSGETIPVTAFRKTGTGVNTNYQYQIQKANFTQSGVYTATWDLTGCIGIDAATEKEVEFNNVSFSYLVGNPEQPEQPTEAGSTIDPAPGGMMSLPSISITFGTDYIDDFAAWTEDFNAEAVVTNTSENTEYTVAPQLEEGGTVVTYDVNIQNEEQADYKVVLKLWGQKYYVLSNARALDTAYVPEDKSWIVLNYTVGNALGVDGITIDGNTTELYYDLQGNRLNGQPESGAYIRISNGKASKGIK